MLCPMMKGHSHSRQRTKPPQRPAVVPTEPPVFTELERRGWVIPMSLGIKKTKPTKRLKKGR
jgi:hypothetical protein